MADKYNSGYADEDDDLKQESQRTLLDDIESAGEAALAAGAGAAVLYRAGGKNVLSNGINKFSRFLSNTTREFAGKELGKDYTVGSAINRMFMDKNSIWNTAAEELHNEKLSIRMDDPNSLFGFLRSMEQAQENSQRVARNMFRGEVATKVADEFTAKIKDPVMAAKTHGFILKMNGNYMQSHASKIAGSVFTPEELKGLDVAGILKRTKELSTDNNRFEEIHAGVKKAMPNVMRDAIKDAGKIFGSANNKTMAQVAKNAALGDQGVTVEDFIKHADQFKSEFKKHGDKNNVAVDNAVNMLKRMQSKLSGDELQKLNNVYVDSTLRIDSNGKIRSFAGVAKAGNKFNDWMAGTLPGTLFKFRDIQQINKAPEFAIFNKGMANPILARVADKAEDSILRNNYMYAAGKVYRINDDGSTQWVKELDNIRLSSGRYGTMANMHKSMFGDKAMRTSQNDFKKYFDIGLDGKTTWLEDQINTVRKFSDSSWRGNVVSNTLNDIERNAVKTDETAYVDQMRNLNRFYEKNAYALDKKTAKALQNQFVDGSFESNLMHHVNGSDEELLDYLLGKGQSSIGGMESIRNTNLRSMLDGYLNDPIKASQNIQVKRDASHFFSGNQTDGFSDLLRMEATKEVFIRHAEDNGNLNAIEELIKNTDASDRGKEEMRRLSHWGIFQYKTGVNVKTYDEAAETIANKNIIDQTEDLLDVKRENVHAEFNKSFRDTLENLASENISIFESKAKKAAGLLDEQQYSDYIVTQKTVGATDLIKALNDGEFFKAAGKAGRQFFAGRGNAEDVTTATMTPYFMAERLSTALNTVGLGLSNLTSTSTFNIMSGLVLKRALPLALGYNYLDYVNDTSRDVTGTSLSTAFLSGAANIDLGARSIMDATGIGSLYNSEKSVNPLLQYWFDKTDYQDHDTREEYYKNGYDPVRSGRYWSFGSVNEFRGGRIQYWMPNMLRQSTSDYKDVSLYGDTDEKWAHSWLPTPTHPFSPIRNIINPYWLEEKHYNDRPYLSTGHLFDDGTLWGAVLNPTIGNIIKPQKQMHEGRLNKDGVDVRKIVEQRNLAIMRKAAGNDYLIKWRNNEPELVDFTNFNAPTSSQRILTVQTVNGEVTNTVSAGYGQYNGGVDPNSMKRIGEAAENMNQPVQMLASPELLQQAKQQEDEGLGIKDKIALSAAKGNAAAKVAHTLIKGFSPQKMIGDINSSIIERAKYDPGQGVMTPEPIHYTTGKAGTRQQEIMNDPDAMHDLINASSGDQYVREAMSMSRSLAGIYGWIANNAVGYGNNNAKHLATSQDMTSISRSFWDTAIGGLGGEASEIGRRFFPEFRRANIINPLMNTMPDWMPNKFRYGDPFTAVPDGEARMPGKGYQSLNRLHPDMFGNYGAFDRFKILADIAPQSSEYRVWAQIASKTITDPNLRKEMKDIKKRRSDMGKQHDFYDYKFLGRGLEYSNKTVEKVIDNNHFKLMGDKTIYRLAGVRVLNDQSGNPTLVKHLHPGMDITIAVDENENYRGNDDDQKTINAAVFLGGDNLAEQMTNLKEAKVRKGDTSAAGQIAKFGALHRIIGKGEEFIAHLDIPYFSDKYARIRSPLESYNAEQVYGTPYQTWSDPIGTYLMPAWERSISNGNSVLAGMAAWMFVHKVDQMASPSRGLKFAANAAFVFSNRGAFIGSTVGHILSMKYGGLSKKLGDVGAAATAVGYATVHPDSVLARGGIGMTVGYWGMKAFGKDKHLGALIGAGIGATDAIINKIANIGNDRDWVPDRTKRKWDMQEYFDRLTYMKFSGLYERTKILAKKEEGVDLDEMIDLYNKSAKRKKKIKYELEDAKKTAKKFMAPDDPERKQIVHEVNQRLQNMQDAQMIMRAGKYTHLALLYRQAALSTMYGAKPDASWMDLIRAIPKNERDYFLEFVKERDPGKQKEILKTASPYLRRALQMAWGQKVKPMESNKNYFRRHRMPGKNWSGWRPNIDLQDVEVKTIKNEGMLLGDFGFYESQLRDQNVINAPTLHPYRRDDTSSLELRSKLSGVLLGEGLTNVDVTLQENDSGIVSTTFNCVKNVAANTIGSIMSVFNF